MKRGQTCAGIQGFAWSQGAAPSIAGAQNIEVVQVNCRNIQQTRKQLRDDQSQTVWCSEPAANCRTKGSGQIVSVLGGVCRTESSYRCRYQHARLRLTGNQIMYPQICRCWGQAMRRDGKLLPKWTNVLDSARVDSLCAAAEAVGAISLQGSGQFTLCICWTEPT